MALDSEASARICWTEAVHKARIPKAPRKAMHSKQCIISKSACSPPCPGDFTAEPKTKDTRTDSGIVVQEQFSKTTPPTTAHHVSTAAALTGDTTVQHFNRASDDASHSAVTHQTFDLRTADGFRDVASWSAQLGPNGFMVKSLTLVHWTTWWGFGGNDWTPIKDSTTLTRTADGLIAVRSARTPEQETCNCSVLGLLSQHNPTFDATEYRGIQSVVDFIECLHASRALKSLADVGALFAKMLDAHSRLLAQHYGIVGDMCRKCDMPMLYLCGSKSSRVSGSEGQVMFSTIGMRKA